MSLAMDRTIALEDRAQPVLFQAQDALKGCRDAIQAIHGRKGSRLTRALRRAEAAIEAIEALRYQDDR